MQILVHFPLNCFNYFLPNRGWIYCPNRSSVESPAIWLPSCNSSPLANPTFRLKNIAFNERRLVPFQPLTAARKQIVGCAHNFTAMQFTTRSSFFTSPLYKEFKEKLFNTFWLCDLWMDKHINIRQFAMNLETVFDRHIILY